MESMLQTRGFPFHISRDGALTPLAATQNEADTHESEALSCPKSVCVPIKGTRFQTFPFQSSVKLIPVLGVMYMPAAMQNRAAGQETASSSDATVPSGRAGWDTIVQVVPFHDSTRGTTPSIPPGLTPTATHVVADEQATAWKKALTVGGGENVPPGCTVPHLRQRIIGGWTVVVPDRHTHTLARTSDTPDQAEQETDLQLAAA